MDTSQFEQITSSLTVSSICGPLGPDVPAGTSLYELEELLDPSSDPNLDPWNNPSRVVDPDGRVIGVLWFEAWAWDAEESESSNEKLEAYVVDEIMERPKPYELLSSSTTILDAVELFGTKDSTIFYVTHINQIVGVLRYTDLFNPLGRLAFFALALEIEDLALSLCQFAPVREQCWLSISDGRRSKATDLFRLRHGREPKPGREVDHLIECTNLVDKANMIWKQRLVAAATRAEVLNFFHELKTVRDRCAHPGTNGALVAQEELARFVISAKRMRDDLRGAMQVQGVPLRRKPTVTLY